MITETVKPVYDFLPPPAARIEDMTQPMGPLEEGDQALVDAAHRLPAGEHVAEHNGTRTRVFKHESLGREQVVADTTTPDGNTEGVSTLIESTPGLAGISANISEWPAGQRGGRSVADVSGSNVGDVLALQSNRAKAQAIKLEVAGKIDAATQRLKEQQIQDPALAEEMAYAEQPHRDDIAERNKDVALAKKAADSTTKDYVNNVGNVGTRELEKIQTRHAMLRAVTAGANSKSLEKASAASEAVRGQHEAGS